MSQSMSISFPHYFIFLFSFFYFMLSHSVLNPSLPFLLSFYLLPFSFCFSSMCLRIYYILLFSFRFSYYYFCCFLSVSVMCVCVVCSVVSFVYLCCAADYLMLMLKLHINYWFNRSSAHFNEWVNSFNFNCGIQFESLKNGWMFIELLFPFNRLNQLNWSQLLLTIFSQISPKIGWNHWLI
jgi:hypothetical protein